MADGIVTIDIDMPLDKFKSDMQLAKGLLKDLGDGAGSEMDSDFKKASDSVVSEAKNVKKDVDAELKKTTAMITPKIDDSEAQKGTQKVITSLRKLPKEQKVKLDADAKKAGIDDFTSLLKRVPKKTRTEILAQAQKGEVIDYEALLKKIPPKILTDVQLNDNASDKLRAIKKESESTETGFTRLKTIVAGSFLGGAALNGITMLVDGLKDVVVEGANASDAMDKFRSTMQLGGFGEDEIKKTSDQVMDYANKTVYGLDDIANTTAQLAANGIKDYMGLTEAAGNLNAQAGGNAETFKSVAMMLTQTAGAGKLTTENWNQLADAIPGASGVLQKAMKDAGAYTGDFRDAMANGEITAQEFSDALMKLGQTDGAKKAAESTKTFEGAIGNLQAAVVDGMKNVIDAFGKDRITGPINGLGNIVQDTFGKITKTIENNKKIIDALGGVFSGVFGAIGNTLSMFATSFKANVAGVLNNKEITQNVESFKKSFDRVMDAIKPIEQAIGGLLGVITGGAFSLAVDLVKGLAKGLGLTGDEADKAKGKLDFSGVARIFSTVSQALNAVLSFVKPVVSALGEMAGVIAKSAFSTFADVLNAVGKALGTAFDKISPLIPALNDTGKGMSFVAKHENTLIGVGKAVGIIATATLGLKGTVGIWNSLSDGILNARIKFLDFKDNVTKSATKIKKALQYSAKIAVNGAKVALKGLLTTAQVVGRGIKAAFLFLQANPFVAIITGVTLAVIALVELYKHNKKFKSFVDGIAKSAKKVFTDIGKWFGNIWKELKKPLSRVWKEIQPIVKSGMKVISSIIELGLTLIKKAWSTAWGLLSGTVKLAWKIIEPIVKIGMKIISNAIKVEMEIIKIAWKLAWNALSTTVKVVWKVMEPIVKLGMGIIKGIISGTMSVISGLWKGAWNLIKGVLHGVWEIMKPIVKTALDVIADVIKIVTNAIKGNWSGVWNGIKNLFSDIWNGIKSIGSGAINGLKDIIIGVAKGIDSAWRGIWDGVSKFFSGIWDGMKNAAKAGFNGIIDFVNGGIKGINGVVHFFGGKKQTIDLIPRLKDGGRMSKSTLALVNDEESPTYREAIFRRDGSVELPQERNVLTHLEAGDAVMPAKQTAMLLGLPQYKGGFGDWLGKAADWIGDVSGDVGEWLADKIDQLEDALKDPLGVLVGLFKKSKNNTEAIWHDIGEGAGKYVPEQAVDWFKGILDGFKKKFDESGGNPPGEGAKRWEPYVKKALAANGLPTSDAYVQAWLRQIQSESGGNPKAVQNGYVDVNTLSGDLAKGLLQTISRTFNAHAFPGHKDIFNGYDNMLAAIHYAKARYGSDMLAVIGHGHGYANGGHVYNKQLAWIAEDGDEFVINNRKPNADSLLASAIKQRAEINPNSFSAKIAHIIDSAKFSGSNGYGMAPSTSQSIGTAHSTQSYTGTDYSQQIEAINRKLDIIADKQVKVDGRSFAVAYERYGTHERNQRDILGKRGMAVDVNF